MTLKRRTAGGPQRATHAAGAVAAIAALGLGGCYSYQPATAPAPGTEVRIELTTEGTAELARHLGPRVTAIDGRIRSWEPDSTMVVSVSSIRAADGSRQPWAGEAPLSIAPSYVEWVGRRTLRRGRSWAVGAVTATAIAAVGVAAIRASRGKDGGGGNPPPPPPP